MKDKDLKFDRSCHVLYSKACKKQIKDKIALHYPQEQQEAVWEKVQLQFVDFISDWRDDLGGKKNFHNGRGGNYDCVALMAYYSVCKEVTSLAEIEEMEGSLFLPAFRKLKFVNANRPFVKKLLYLSFKNAKKQCDKWGDFKMNLAPFDKDKPIYYEFTECPTAEFAKKYGLLEVMPALCNPDFEAMELIGARLVRTTTCSNGCRCDYTVCGDEDSYLREHPEYRDEAGYRRNREEIFKEIYMKYHIEKNTVQETLVIPLYGRKMCSELFPELFYDKTAVRLIEEIDYDFSELAAKSKNTMQQFGFLEVAMRQSDIAWEIRDYLKTHPEAAVVNLGCGLDDTGRSCDNGSCRIYNVDFPDVIEVRNQILPAGEREENIGCDLNDTSWFEKIDASGGAVFFAAGVFYYFLKEQVEALTSAMAEHFKGGRLVFDAACRSAVKLMLKTWIKDAEIKDVGAYFAVADAKTELASWSSKISVSSRGYMLGYQSLDYPSVKGFYRFLAKVGDNIMKMQIVRFDFEK